MDDTYDPRVRREVPIDTTRFPSRWQLVFNQRGANKRMLDMFVDVLEEHLYIKAKGKTHVQLNTRGLLENVLPIIMNRLTKDEQRLLPPSGKAWGLAISRLLHPSLGDKIGRWIRTDYKSNKQGRVYYLSRKPEDDAYQTKGRTDCESEPINTPEPLSHIKLKILDKHHAKKLLLAGKIPIDDGGLMQDLDYTGDDYAYILPAWKEIKDEKAAREESTNNTLENLL